MDLNVKLQVFEGPLDLLLHLLDKNKVNIYDIPIAEITDQYMEYIGQAREEEGRIAAERDAKNVGEDSEPEQYRIYDMDVMSEFLVMAATLLDIKSRMLLPPDPEAEEEEGDPRADLVQQLLEYKMYKCMALELKDREIEASRSFYKPPTIPQEVLAYEAPVNLEELVRDVTLARLNAIFQEIMRKQSDRVDPIHSKFGRIEKEEVSLEQRTAALTDYARSHRSFSFRQLLEAQHDREEVIVTFLAILELMRTGTIRVQQEELFSDILITSQVAEEGA